MGTFNLYCDESCHLENDQNTYMILGYLRVPYNQMKLHANAIKEVKERHHFFGEIKWSKVANSQSKFYSDIVSYFFASDLAFRAIVIKKENINNEQYGQDFDTFYYKMYYQLFNHKIDMLSSYNIYLDVKDTLNARKVRKLKEILQTKYGVVRNLQSIQSHESLFLQLADLLIGAIGYNLRPEEEQKVTAKKALINRIQKDSHQSLKKSSYLSESKMNLFFIDLQ